MRSRRYSAIVRPQSLGTTGHRGMPNNTSPSTDLSHDLVIEATGNSMAVSRVLSRFVARVIIANGASNNFGIEGRMRTAIAPNRRGRI